MRIFIALFVASTIASACKPDGPQAPALTDDDVAHYLSALKQLDEAGPGVEARLLRGETVPETPQLERAMRLAGFRTQGDFQRVNERVAWAFVHNGWLVNPTDDALDASLAAPNVPAPAKAEMAKARERLHAAFAHELGWDDVARSPGAARTTPEDAAVVLRHHDELRAAFAPPVP